MNSSALEKYRFESFDASDYLKDDEDAQNFLAAIVEDCGGDASLIAKALGTVARSKASMASVSAKTGLSRESLYKSLSGERAPSFSTILKVCEALDIKISFALASRNKAKPETNATAVNSKGVILPASLVSVPSQPFRAVGSSSPRIWESVPAWTRPNINIAAGTGAFIKDHSRYLNSWYEESTEAHTASASSFFEEELHPFQRSGAS